MVLKYNLNGIHFHVYRVGSKYTITIGNLHERCFSSLPLEDIEVIVSAIVLHVGVYRKMMKTLWANRLEPPARYDIAGDYRDYGIPIRRKSIRFLWWVIYWPEVLTMEELDYIHTGIRMKIEELLTILIDDLVDFNVGQFINKLLYTEGVSHDDFYKRYLIPVLDARVTKKIQRYVSRQYIFGKIKNIHYV